MHKPHALHQTSKRRRAALWSVPLLAAALGLSSPWAEAQTGYDRGLSAPETPGLGTTGTGIGGADAGGAVAPPTATAMRDMRASELIDMDVRSPRGEELGEIQDLIIDVNNQRVQYAVLAFGGFLGMGEKLFAYPVRMLRMGAEREELVLNVNRDQLREWPGFERNRWPNWNDEEYLNEIERFHGGANAVVVEPSDNMQLVRASTLIGKEVNDRFGNDAGEIEDVVVNLRNGAVHYVVMEFDRAWNPNDRLLALPMTAFDFPARGDIDLRLNIDRDRLDMRAGFERDQWPDLDDPAWMRNNERWLGRATTELEQNARDAVNTPLRDTEVR